MEIEINFRFDEHARTANTKVDPNEPAKNTHEMDYDFKAEATNLKEWFESSSSSSEAESTTPSKRLDDILLDCEISDNMIMPRTYWMPCDGKPRCALEQLAFDVFHHHVPSEGFDYDRDASGAEWWCQLRPYPQTGRHKAVQTTSSEDETKKDPFANGISFHVDKDEELRILTGGSTYVHPHLSTITYLTDLGSPTLILDCQVHPLTGEWIVPQTKVEGFLSWPSVGKHTSFDGRYLHASPPDLMGAPDAFAQQIKAAKAVHGTSRAGKRRCRRVTFLVNVWLNYKPYDVHPFPDSMLDKMSGREAKTRIPLAFGKSSSSSADVQTAHVRSKSTAAIASDKTNDDDSNAQPFSWPLGDSQSGERLECLVPLQSIQTASENGANVRIHWDTKESGDEPTCFRLLDGKSSTATTAASPEAVSKLGDEATSKAENRTDSSETRGNKRPRTGEATADATTE